MSNYYYWLYFFSLTSLSMVLAGYVCIMWAIFRAYKKEHQ